MSGIKRLVLSHKHGLTQPTNKDSFYVNSMITNDYLKKYAEVKNQKNLMAIPTNFVDPATKSDSK